MITVSELRHIPHPGDSALRELARVIERGTEYVRRGSIPKVVPYRINSRDEASIVDVIRRQVG